MKSTILNIVLVCGLILLVSLSSCTKKCQVNGCRVRMEHRHSGDKFKSKIRRWYTFQNPRVGRDYKRDKSPDKIPWDGPDIEGSAEANMLVSNDTSAFGDDGFMGDEFYEGDSSGGDDNFLPEEEETGKKKRKKRRGEEEEVKEEPAGDPWDIEHIKEEDPVLRKPIIEEKKEENSMEEEITPEEKEDNKKEESKEEKKEKKKSKKDLEKEREERLKKELLEEEEEDDDWGF